MEQLNIRWTDYLRYRVVLRGFDLDRIEEIVRYSEERYRDDLTGRIVVVGKHGQSLVLVPYEIEDETIVPVTIHATSRQQIELRLKSGRYLHE
jgi:hypothetical protein